MHSSSSRRITYWEREAKLGHSHAHFFSYHLRQDVKKRLVQIAQQSTEGRQAVIEALINVVKDPKAKKEWPVARRWIIAVELLGYLRANEAISDLISN